MPKTAASVVRGGTSNRVPIRRCARCAWKCRNSAACSKALRAVFSGSHCRPYCSTWCSRMSRSSARRTTATAHVRRLAHDLHLPIEILGAPTVREANGLAMSDSRSQYLTPRGTRARRRHLQDACARCATKYRGGKPRKTIEAMRVMRWSKGPASDYAVLRRARTWPIPPHGGTAANDRADRRALGPARLIDNLLLTSSKLTSHVVFSPYLGILQRSRCPRVAGRIV